jgi:REP element-mobilizing transposase RayT
MPSHLHLICAAKEGLILADIMRDFKKYTSTKIIELILNEPESRRE